MLQDTIATETKYNLFVEKTAASKLVWVLKNKEGWANSHSNDDEKVDVIPFWSDKADAKACARNEWKGYLPVMIPLPMFLETWCLGMAENGTLAGINWDVNMFGKEANVLHVALDVLERLNTINSNIKFLNYESIDDFIAEIKSTTE